MIKTNIYLNLLMNALSVYNIISVYLPEEKHGHGRYNTSEHLRQRESPSYKMFNLLT